MLNIGVIGAGGWGTALAVHLSRLGHRAKLWVRRPELCREIATTRENRIYNPGHRIPDDILVTSDMGEAAAGCEVLLLAVPSHTMSGVLEDLKSHVAAGTSLISATKGIENDTLRRMSEVLLHSLAASRSHILALSGPSFAEEVLRGDPTAIALACESPTVAHVLQRELSGNNLRLYLNSDMVGTELGGAVKNVIAIAAGVLNGLGFGANAVAALITRGLAEMRRLALAAGGRAETLAGLAGLGDLVLTCTGNLSRNRRVGIALGQGQKLDDIVSHMNMVAEGVKTARSTLALANRLGVVMPIVEQTHAILYEGVAPRDAVQRLMERELKQEEWR